MAAESANELGKTVEAQGYLEMVRERARGNNASILPKVTTTNQEELRNAIRHERRVELGMEFDRFYDLVRWGNCHGGATFCRKDKISGQAPTIASTAKRSG